MSQHRRDSIHLKTMSENLKQLEVSKVLKSEVSKKILEFQKNVRISRISNSADIWHNKAILDCAYLKLHSIRS